MNCEKCLRSVVFHVFAVSQVVTRNHYSCAEHVAEISSELTQEVAEMERQSGNPFYPRVSKLGFSEVRIIEF
jgi:hypothetical protein